MTSPAYARGTKVSSETSRSEIERLLKRFGVAHFGYISQPGLASLVFQHEGENYRISVPLPDVKDSTFDRTPAGRRRDADQRLNAIEQEERERWRVLLLAIKAELALAEVWDKGLAEALAQYRQLPDGRTVQDTVMQDGTLPPALTWGGQS